MVQYVKSCISGMRVILSPNTSRIIHIFLEAKLVAKLSIFPLRPTNPPSRAADAVTRTHAKQRQALCRRPKVVPPAQSGFSGLRGLSAGKVFVFNSGRAPRRSAFAVAMWRLALRAIGYSHIACCVKINRISKARLSEHRARLHAPIPQNKFGPKKPHCRGSAVLSPYSSDCGKAKSITFRSKSVRTSCTRIGSPS